MNKNGMTLLEVIIAAMILSVTVGGILFIFSTEKGVVARTGRQMIAVDLGQQTIEALKNEVGADIWLTGSLTAIGIATTVGQGEWTDWEALPGDLGDKFAGQGKRYRVTNIDADLNYDSDNNADLEDDLDYKQVEVVVDWSEPSPISN